ncbi:MAG: hypothetical protein U5J95_04465 [Balneolaceae bacterium]|nr:hypothetical protein [Balneolaceae bacterium]
MDKIRLFIFISVLGVLIYLGFIYDPDRGVIDDEYVASESYRKLEEKIQGEKSGTASDEQKVRMIFQNVIESTDSIEVDFPLNDIAGRFLGGRNNWDTLFDFRFKKLGMVKQDLIKIYFVLLQKQGTYNESGLFMVTSQNDSLLSFRTIGQFKDTVIEKAETQIYAKTNGMIVTEVTRKRFYPVEQENVKTYSYEILESGKIKQVEN